MPQDAEDATQGFFAHLIEKQRLGLVVREKGRFRSFLLAAIQNYLADQRDRSTAQKRGGGMPVVSLDAAKAESRYGFEPVDNLDPEKVFERRWALTILGRALERLELEFAAEDKKRRFEELKAYLLGDSGLASYAEAGRRSGMTEGAVKVAVLRLRGRFREIFREEISSTVDGEEELDAETRHLMTVLGG